MGTSRAEVHCTQVAENSWLASTASSPHATLCWARRIQTVSSPALGMAWATCQMRQPVHQQEQSSCAIKNKMIREWREEQWGRNTLLFIGMPLCTFWIQGLEGERATLTKQLRCQGKRGNGEEIFLLVQKGRNLVKDKNVVMREWKETLMQTYQIQGIKVTAQDVEANQQNRAYKSNSHHIDVPSVINNSTIICYIKILTEFDFLQEKHTSRRPLVAHVTTEVVLSYKAFYIFLYSLERY